MISCITILSVECMQNTNYSTISNCIMVYKHHMSDYTELFQVCDFLQTSHSMRSIGHSNTLFLLIILWWLVPVKILHSHCRQLYIYMYNIYRVLVFSALMDISVCIV